MRIIEKKEGNKSLEMKSDKKNRNVKFDIGNSIWRYYL